MGYTGKIYKVVADLRLGICFMYQSHKCHWNQ